MRDLGSGSAVLADADRKPCGEDVFGCVQIPVMGCSAVRARPCPDFEAGHALRPGLRPAVGAGLCARIIPVDGYELSPVPFGLVFEHSTELRPSGVHDAPVQPVFRGLAVGEPMVRIIRVGFRRASFGHVLHVEVFDDHRLVLADYPRAQLVEEVTAHVRDSGVGAGHLEGGFPTIVAAFGFAGQRLLLPFEPLGEFLVVAWIRYGLPVAGDGVAVHSQVDSDGVPSGGEKADGLLHEDADMPSSGGVQAYGHGARLRLAGQRSGPSYRQWFAHLGEREFVALGIPFERASSVFGASAVGFRLELRIVAGLLEEVGERRLQMPQRLLQGYAGHFVHVRVFSCFLPLGEHGAGLDVGDAPALRRPCDGTGLQREIVDLSAAADRAPEQLFLLGRRVEAEPVRPLACMPSDHVSHYIISICERRTVCFLPALKDRVSANQKRMKTREQKRRTRLQIQSGRKRTENMSAPLTNSPASVEWMIPRLKRWLASGGLRKNASKIPANKRITPLV